MSGLRAAFFSALATLAVAGAASAQSPTFVTIESAGPLARIHLGNDLRCQVEYAGDSAPAFNTGGAEAGMPGLCGTSVAIGPTVYGYPGNLHAGNEASSVEHSHEPFTPVSQTGPTGSGTEADPFRVETVVAAGSTGVQVTRVDTYVQGDDFYRSDVRVSNPGPNEITGAVYHAADCLLDGSDHGFGFQDAATGAIHCSTNPGNEPQGRTGGFVAITSGSHYFEGNYFAATETLLDGTQLPDTCDCASLEESPRDPQDNGAALSWPLAVAAGGESTTSFLTDIDPPSEPELWLRPQSGTATVGQPHVITARTVRAEPISVVRYSVEGVNPQGPADTEIDDATGNTSIELNSETTGTDTVSAFLDLDADGIKDPGEPGASAEVTWQAPAPPPPPPSPPPGSSPPPPPPPAPPGSPLPDLPDLLPLQIETALTLEQLSDPAPFRETNVQPVGAGAVFVRLPRTTPGASAAARAAQAPGVPRGFIPITAAAQLPIGSTINANRGQIRMETVANRTGSRTQTGNFRSGTFTVLQKRSSRPVTELVLKGGTYRGCPRIRRGRGAESDTSRHRRSRRSRVRRLFGNARGRYRTRGRYSAATVRGTSWLTEDRCGGTLTRVRSGRVQVRDFRLRRTINLRAGKSYLAKAGAVRRR